MLVNQPAVWALTKFDVCARVVAGGGDCTALERLAIPLERDADERDV